MKTALPISQQLKLEMALANRTPTARTTVMTTTMMRTVNRMKNNLPGYNVVRDEQVVIDRFNFIGREVEIHLPSRQNPIAALDALHNLMSLLLDSCRTGDMVAITLSAPEQPGLSIEL